MQLPIVGFLAIASFQTQRATGKTAFGWAGYGWVLNFGYIAATATLGFFEAASISLAGADPLVVEYGALFLDTLTSICFWFAYLAANKPRGSAPSLRRWPTLAIVAFGLASWSWAVVAIRGSEIPGLFIGFSAPMVIFSVVARWLLGAALRDQARTEVTPRQGPYQLYVAALFYAAIQPLYLFSQTFPSSQTLGFFLGFAAKVAIAFGFVTLFSALASKFSGEQRALETARRLLGRIRHELNTPLGELKNWVDAAMREAPHGKIRLQLLNMESATQRALAITTVRDDLLYEAITVQEPIAAALAQKEIVNINTLIQTAILAVKSTRSEEVNWQVSFGAGNCIRCTREQIIQIFINILRNAYDALPENRGRIVVNAAQAKRETEDEFKSDRIVRITIIDDGEGFDASLHQEAFKDGFTTRRGQDRGHGLAVVRQLLALNDGEIEIVSPVSKDPTRRGTSVRLTFPRVRCQDDAGGAAT